MKNFGINMKAKWKMEEEMEQVFCNLLMGNRTTENLFLEKLKEKEVLLEKMEILFMVIGLTII